jgi:hypothetical protein
MDVCAPRGGLVVDQSHTRFAKRSPPAFRQPEAKIDIIEVDRQIAVIEAADGQELRPFDRQARRGHRGDFVRLLFGVGPWSSGDRSHRQSEPSEDPAVEPG